MNCVICNGNLKTVTIGGENIIIDFCIKGDINCKISGEIVSKYKKVSEELQ